jgi:hypothetical protein
VSAFGIPVHCSDTVMREAYSHKCFVIGVPRPAAGLRQEPGGLLPHLHLRQYGLSSTLYDPTNGAVGIQKRALSFPAYITYLQPGQDDALADVSGATFQQLESSAGSRQFWGVDINISASGDAASRGNVSVGLTAKYPGPSGFDWTLANAAGAIVSSPQDMAKWFRALMVDPDHAGLVPNPVNRCSRNASHERICERTQCTGNAHVCAGVGGYEESGSPQRPRRVQCVLSRIPWWIPGVCVHVAAS